MSSTVLYEARGEIARITLNRPDRLNTFNGAMFAELNAAIDRFRDDPALKVAILAGAGERAFSAGVDLKAMQEDLAEGRTNKVPHMIHFVDQGYCNKPIVAAIRGYCVGEGVHAVLGCDFRVCAEDAVFYVPEVAVGMALARLSWQCVRTIGLPAATELCLLCEKKDAQWALQHQLVHKVTPPGGELAAAEKIAGRLCTMSMPALQATKQTLNRAYEKTYQEMLEFGLPLRAQVLAAGDATARSQAFLDKKK